MPVGSIVIRWTKDKTRKPSVLYRVEGRSEYNNKNGSERVREISALFTSVNSQVEFRIDNLIALSNGEVPMYFLERKET